MKSNRSAKLKRGSTRHISEITAIATEFGNSAKIIVPRSWLGRRVIAFLHSEGEQMSSEALLSNFIPFAGSGLTRTRTIMTKDVNKYAKKDTIHYCSCDNWDDLFRCGLYNL